MGAWAGQAESCGPCDHLWTNGGAHRAAGPGLANFPVHAWQTYLTVLQGKLAHGEGMTARQASEAQQPAERSANMRPAQPRSQRAGERRTAPRHAKTARTASSEQDDNPYSLIGREFVFTAPAMAISVLAGMIASQSVPSIGVLAVLLAAIAATGASRLVLPLEARFAKKLLSRIAFMGFCVGAPLAWFGLAMWLWASSSSAAALPVALSALISVNVAIATQQGRLPSMLCAVIAVAVGVLLVAAPLTAAAIVVVTFVGQLTFGSWYFAKIVRDQQTRAVAHRRENRAESLIADFEQSGQGWFWETDRRGAISYVSPRIAKLLGRTNTELVGKPFISLFRLDEGDDKESERTLRFHLSTRSSFSELSVLAATEEAEERWWSVTGRPVLDSYNNFLGFRGSGTDLTEMKLSQRHVTQLARFDSLTKLANRFQMAEWLEKILQTQQEERRACAVFLLDLDRFKHVNDTMGHPAGDALLRQVADRLRSTVGGAGNVGRLGGDEFQVILPGRQKLESLAHLAHRIIENLSQPYSIDGARVTIGASVGISLCPDNGTTSEELIRNADLALYAAKDGGRGRYHFYADDLHADAEERRQLEQDLRDAMSKGDLELHYQPVVSTTTEKITGFEALLRWNHPSQGYLSPARFVPIAEESGLVAQIGEWALRAACAQLARWPENVRIAVNVSPLQFANPALPAIITSALASTQVTPSRLELEITESVFLNDDDTTEAMFSALKAIGVRLALDDFGTGYSSLGYLKKAPFDKIKIDQSFVRGATLAGSRNGAIISAIVSLAESLGMETTAEGVETLDELDLVRELGCSHIQGFIYEKALTAQRADEKLASGLIAIASGPQSARQPRQTMLRKVVLGHGANRYNGTIRNISSSGAMIEGLWDVPKDTVFDLQLSPDYTIQVTTRWSRQDRMGVEFAQPLAMEKDGSVSLLPPRRTADGGERSILRKAG
jgi:diguanylate cyclase (GGDEF)-like protein/PAS domain S-box-containing protein